MQLGINYDNGTFFMSHVDSIVGDKSKRVNCSKVFLHNVMTTRLTITNVQFFSTLYRYVVWVGWGFPGKLIQHTDDVILFCSLSYYIKVS